VDPLNVIQSPISLTKQERRRAYRCKRYACFKYPPFKCCPPAVEPQSINSPTPSVFTDGEFASSDSENPFLLLEFSNSNSDSDADSDIDSVSNLEKVEIMKSTLALSVSTSVSVHKRFPAKTFHSQASKCSPQQLRQIVINEITIHAWPTHYSKAYNLFHLSSFNENGCKFPESSDIWLCDEIHSQDSSVTLPFFF
jgi:hypothetical protein